MRKEYDIRGGERGKFYGKVTGTRVIRAAGAKARSSKAAKGKGDFDEAISLLTRVRPHMRDTQGAEKLKEKIDKFLDRVTTQTNPSGEARCRRTNRFNPNTD